MTQDELTAKAIEKIKSEEPKEPIPSKPSKPSKSSQQSKTETLKANQIKLGNRIITLKPWNGKTKKKFRKEFEFVGEAGIEELDLQSIIELLVYDHVEEDYQFTEMELQYLMSEIKRISIDDKVESESTCPNCASENIIKTTLNKCVKYTPDTLPAEYKDYKFENINRTFFKETVDDIMSSEDYDGVSSELDIEIACKIKHQNKTPKQMLEEIDNMPLKELNELITAYASHLAKVKISQEHTCRFCKKRGEFEIDIITEIFETLTK